MQSESPYFFVRKKNERAITNSFFFSFSLRFSLFSLISLSPLFSQQCGAAPNNDCSDATYKDYNGAAKGLLEDSCDIAFVKVPTIECGAVDAGEYCKSAAKATCQTTKDNAGKVTGKGTCDSKSVYAKEYTVAENTFVRLKGYDLTMPSHLIMANKMTDAEAKEIMKRLPTHWKAIEGKELKNAFGSTTENVLGKTFVESLDAVPFYYEKYKVIRPITVVVRCFRDVSLSFFSIFNF